MERAGIDPMQAIEKAREKAREYARMQEMTPQDRAKRQEELERLEHPEMYEENESRPMLFKSVKVSAFIIVILLLLLINALITHQEVPAEMWAVFSVLMFFSLLNIYKKGYLFSAIVCQ